MNPVPRKLPDEERNLIDEWLKNNKATTFEAYKKSETVELKIQKRKTKRF